MSNGISLICMVGMSAGAYLHFDSVGAGIGVFFSILLYCGRT